MALTTVPIAERFGVEIKGLDLNEVTESHLFPEIRAVFERHSTLLFRGQSLTAEAHLRIARAFGPIEDRSADERKPEQGFEIPEVSNMTADGGVTGAMDLHTLNLKANQLWHTDGTFLPVPALVNILVAQVVTEEGGETELATTRAAFADLPPRRQEELRGLWIRHRYSQSRALISKELARLPMFKKWPDQTWRAVWRNPATGDEAVYLASHAVEVLGRPADEGRVLIDELIDRCTQPAYTYAHSWRDGDVLIWDERATLHRGRPWDYSKPRRLTSICASATEADGLDEMRLPS